MFGLQAESTASKMFTGVVPPAAAELGAMQDARVEADKNAAQPEPTCRVHACVGEGVRRETYTLTYRFELRDVNIDVRWVSPYEVH